MVVSDSSYPGLANFVSSNPDFLIVRKFANLNARNILYLQAQLANLEEELNVIEGLGQQTPQLKELDKEWKKLSEATDAQLAEQNKVKPGKLEPGSLVKPTQDTAQWKKMLQIRQVLCEYNNALIQQSQIAPLSSPHRNDLHKLRRWLERTDFGDSFLSRTENVWHPDKKNDDFVAFKTAGGISYEVSRLLLWIWERCCCCCRRQRKDRTFYIDGSADGGVGRIIATILASVIPLVPIVVLHAISKNRLWVRMGLIIVFTAVFAFALIFAARLKPDQLLAVTLALAALQVVYVGSTS